MVDKSSKINVWKSVAHVLFITLQGMIAFGVHDMRTSTGHAREIADEAKASISIIQETMFTKMEGQKLRAKIQALESTMASPPHVWYKQVQDNSNRIIVLEHALHE